MDVKPKGRLWRPNREAMKTVLLSIGLGVCLAVLIAARAWAADEVELPAYEGPSNASLDTVRTWLWENGPDGTNGVARRERMAVIQAAADAFPHQWFKRYLASWVVDPERADAFEQCGVLYYLRQATDHVIEDIQATRVKEGLVVWHLYNMGYVFKTAEVCFGIDVHVRDAARLVQDMDFLLVTHEHPDHHLGGAIAGMIDAGKPVVTRFYKGTTIVAEPTEFRYGPVRIRIDIGDHTPRRPSGQNNMLMFQVDCGASAFDCTIYHSGDGANYAKMTPDKPVDIFIPHVACSGMDVAEAIRHVKPKITFVSHVMEISHNIGGARWTYDFAFERVKAFAEDEALVFTWGERWIYPGTTYGVAGEERTASR